MAGRPKAVAARGRVTMAEAAKLAGVSKSAVQRRVDANEVPSRVEPGGFITIARSDVKLIQPREPGEGDGRKAYMVRPDLERAAAWERTAAAAGKPVSSWLAALADAASGYNGSS